MNDFSFGAKPSEQELEQRRLNNSQKIKKIKTKTKKQKPPKNLKWFIKLCLKIMLIMLLCLITASGITLYKNRHTPLDSNRVAQLRLLAVKAVYDNQDGSNEALKQWVDDYQNKYHQGLMISDYYNLIVKYQVATGNALSQDTINPSKSLQP